MDNNTLSFEDSFSRLEVILDTMNSGKASLEDSLKLYEEANSLIINCNKKLAMAENKIETLIKNRDGSLTLIDEKPVLQEFNPQSKTPS